MRKVSWVLTVLVAFSAMAMAQASRTWVSGVGDDANPCSRTAPCKTWAGAISKTAAGGEMDALDPGGFGAVTITKAITIDGNNWGSVLVAGTNGIVVSAGASDTVIIRNLSIDGLGQTASPGIDGIKGITFGNLIVEHVNIFNFSNDGIDIVQTNARFHISDCNIDGAGFSGIDTVTGHGSVTNCHIQNSARGIHTGAHLTAFNTVVSGSSGTAFSSISGGVLTIDHSVGTGGGTGVLAVGTVYMSNSTISHNAVGLTVSGGTLNSFGNNQLSGNNSNGATPTAALQE